jgi:hypothetical protein
VYIYFQIGTIKVQKNKGYQFEGLIFTREKDGPGAKPFTFNLPLKTVIPLRDALIGIVRDDAVSYNEGYNKYPRF